MNTMTPFTELPSGPMPRLRFSNASGQSYGEWKEYRINEIARILKGDGVAKADVVNEGEFLCVQYGELFNYYSEKIECVRSRTNFTFGLQSKKGDILMPDADVTPDGLGRGSALMVDGVYIGYHTNVVRLRGQANPVFICHSMNSRQRIFQQKVVGTTIKMLYPREVGAVKICIPTSIEEQNKIADALSSIGQKIDSLNAKKSSLEDYKRGLMQKLFSREIRFTREDGSPFSDWKTGRLAEVAHIVMGQSPSSESYNDKGQGLPLIQGNADILDRKSAPRKFTSAPNKTCQPGDILLSVRAPAGEVAMCEHVACLGRGVASVTPLATESRDFCYHMLLHAEPKWERIGQGAIFAAINGDDLRSFPVQIPEFEEQVKIAEVLSNFDSKIRQVELQIKHTEAFKKGLLQKLFV